MNSSRQYNIGVIICFLLSWSLLQSQSIVDSDLFFSKYSSAIAANNNGNVALVKNEKFPWIEDFDLRTETRDFDFGQQEYTFRLSPTTRKKRKAQAALYQSYQANAIPQDNEVNKDLIYELYNDWFKLYLIEQELRLIKELKTIFLDRQLIYDKKLSVLDVNFSELIELELDKNDLSIQLHKLEIYRAEILENYFLDNAALDFRNLISTEAILSKVGSIKIVQDEELAKYQYERNLIDQELALEAAEQKQIFDFAQLKYRGPHDNILEERLSVGVGIRIPNDGNRKLKIARLHQEQLELDAELDLDRIKVEKRSAEMSSKLSRMVQTLNYFEEVVAIESSVLQKIETKISEKQGFDPLLILSTKEEKIKRDFERLALLEDVYLEYIKILAASGRLAASPFVNYLKA